MGHEDRFNIDSFLNAQPVCLKGKGTSKAILVLARAREERGRPVPPTYELGPLPAVVSEQSITLVTLP